MYEDISSASDSDELPPISAFTKNQPPAETRTVRLRASPPPPPDDLSGEAGRTVRFASSPPPQPSVPARQRVGAARGRPRATPYQRPPPPPERGQPSPPPRTVVMREEEPEPAVEEVEEILIDDDAPPRPRRPQQRRRRAHPGHQAQRARLPRPLQQIDASPLSSPTPCLLYTSDAADE